MVPYHLSVRHIRVNPAHQEDLPDQDLLLVLISRADRVFLPCRVSQGSLLILSRLFLLSIQAHLRCRVYQSYQAIRVVQDILLVHRYQELHDPLSYQGILEGLVYPVLLVIRVHLQAIIVKTEYFFSLFFFSNQKATFYLYCHQLPVFRRPQEVLAVRSDQYLLSLLVYLVIRYYLERRRHLFHQ